MNLTRPDPKHGADANGKLSTRLCSFVCSTFAMECYHVFSKRELAHAESMHMLTARLPMQVVTGQHVFALLSAARYAVFPHVQQAQARTHTRIP